MQNRENDYKSSLLAELRDPDYAAGYVSAAAAESWETFLLALRDVADAQSGMAKLASEAGVDRVNLYRMLSERGNPRFKNLNLVLKALGLRIAAVPDAEESGTRETSVEPAVADQLRIDSSARNAIEKLTKPANIRVAIPNIVRFFDVEPQAGIGNFSFSSLAGLSGYACVPPTLGATLTGFGNALEGGLQDQSGVADSGKTAVAPVETYVGQLARSTGIGLQQPVP